jgi:cation/acetate symporter
MVLNFIIAIVVSRLTPAPPAEIRDLVDRVRLPRAAFGEKDAGAVDH